jgi:exonuclease VII small subunit
MMSDRVQPLSGSSGAPAAAACGTMLGVSTTDDAASQLDALVTRLERAAEQLRSGDVSPDAAATLVEDAASLASQASAELDRLSRAAAAEPHPGQDPLL